MDGMESASYQYDGPMQTVVDIVAPIATRSGFTETNIDLTSGMDAAQKRMSQKLAMAMSSREQKMFTHPNGEMLIVLRMDISTSDRQAKLLTVQYMNPRKMAGFAEK
jgi:hypothetical protein